MTICLETKKHRVKCTAQLFLPQLKIRMDNYLKTKNLFLPNAAKSEQDCRPWHSQEKNDT
jgi:hypothetical protein